MASDLDGNLIATSHPMAGARHNAAAIEQTGWAHTLRNAAWLADSAYIATNALTPVKKPIGISLAETTKQFNKEISSIRCAVERCIAHLKNWRIIATGYRRQLKHLPLVIALISKLELYRLGW